MWSRALLLAAALFSLVLSLAALAAPPELPALSATRLAGRWGYATETHSVRTADGRTLGAHRIPRGRGGRGWRGGGGGTPVLFVHGLACSGEVFLLAGPNSLPLLLADLGFDVWLANLRGSRYSSAFVSASPAEWDFSWHENGYYDVAATIDYMVSVTGRPWVLGVGHSMGGTAMLVLLAERPEYNARLRASVMLAPASHFRHNRGVFAMLRRKFRWTEAMFRLRPAGPVPFADLPLLLPACAYPPGAVADPCIRMFTQGAGPFRSFNHTVMSEVLKHWPQGVSLGQVFHFSQILMSASGTFKKYDYGPERNLILYGATESPPYALKNVMSPVFIFYSESDYQIHPKDLRSLAAELPGLAGLHLVQRARFNHLDFLFDDQAYHLVYKRVADTLLKYA